MPSTDYNSIQSQLDHQKPTAADFPPIQERVDQAPDIYGPLKARAIERVTYQGNELCNLQCPGCFLTEWLEPDGDVQLLNVKRRTSGEEFEDHIKAIRPDMPEVFLLGAEVTMTPVDTKDMIAAAKSMGSKVMAITNGSAKPHQVDAALLPALEAGDLHKLNVSLDSIDPAINDVLRGKKGAAEATLDTIRRYVEKDFPIKLQITVWPRNYASILETVQTLYDEYGVRGFAFHYGSMENVRPEAAKALGGYLHPEAWRALCTQLEVFNQAHFDDLQHFNYPFVYYTQEELAKGVIGDPELLQQYEEHTIGLEAGDSKPLPFNACPAASIPQVYLYANDKGANGNGRISLCNIDTGGSNKYFADFNETTKQFEVDQDPASNQLAGMTASPNLCPAMSKATGGTHETGSDRFETDSGDLFHACRFVSNNQMPQPATFSEASYQKWLAHYVESA